jgi:hypothetical protein
VNLAAAIFVVTLQLVGLGAGLPQVMAPSYATEGVEAGRDGVVTVSFDVIDGYAINRVPAIQLKLEAVDGIVLAESSMISPEKDPKSDDVYYVDVPEFDVSLKAAKAGKYEIPGTLIYFFCSKADGFCSRQIVDVTVPVTVQ